MSKLAREIIMAAVTASVLSTGNLIQAKDIIQCDNFPDQFDYTNTIKSIIEEKEEAFELSTITFRDKMLDARTKEIERQEEIKQQEELERQRQEEIKQRTKYINIYIDDLRVKSDVDSSLINKFLEGTGLEGLGEAYIEAESIYGVNAIFLMALTAHESSWGESEFAVYRNNISGYQAYNLDVDKAKYFESKADCIYTTAETISDLYLDPNGQYYEGYSLWNVNVKYSQENDGSPNQKWARGIINIMNEFYWASQDHLDEYTFIILK